MSGAINQPMRKVDRLVKRNGTMCWLCKEPVDMKLKHPDPMEPTCDHFVPRGMDGINAQINLRLAHRHCNYHRAVLFPKSLVFTEDELRKFTRRGRAAEKAQGPHELPIGGRTDVPRGYAKRILDDKPCRLHPGMPTEKR